MAHSAQTPAIAPLQGGAIEMLDGKVVLYPGDCRDSIRMLADNSIDAVVTDPPYALVSIQKRFGKPGSAPAKDGDVYARASAGFMGKQWDTGEVAFAAEFWEQVFRVLKPGGHVAAFSGTRTYHRMTCAIEDAGFEIRDQLAWVYGAGFPKSQNVAKFIDKHLGIDGKLGGPRSAAHAALLEKGVARRGDKHEGWDRPWMDDPAAVTAAQSTYLPGSEEARRFDGWGTALKPAWEPICLARKPLIGTVAENVLAHGTGAVNIDGCRVGSSGGPAGTNYAKTGQFGIGGKADIVSIDAGRWPANIVHDGSDEVLAAFPQTTSGTFSGHRNEPKTNGVYGSFSLQDERGHMGDSGSAARFFYSAKADKNDRFSSRHPTVKPVSLCQWLCRLVTPPGGIILDPFAGSGTTGEAAWREGFSAILCERETDYIADIKERLAYADKGPATRKARMASRKAGDECGPLFANDNQPVREAS